MGSGTGSQIVGGVVVIGLGIIVIAAIFQLGQKGNPIVPAAESSYQSTLTSLFK